MLTVDQHAAAPAQDALSTPFDVLPRENDLVIGAYEYADQHQSAAQDQSVRKQWHGRIHKSGGHVYPTLDVFRQIANALHKKKKKKKTGRNYL